MRPDYLWRNEQEKGLKSAVKKENEQDSKIFEVLEK